MKHYIRIILQYTPWLLLLFGIDAFAALLLWLADARAFYAMTGVILLATLLLFSAVCCTLIYRERKRETAFLDFISNPDEYHEELLLKNVTSSQREALSMLGKILRDYQDTYAGLQTQLAGYEEYVESWAHETKTPLSLLTLLLDNRGDELPAAVSFKLDYIRNRMQESIDHMLFYARLKGNRKDYLFEYIPVRNCIEDVLEDYKPLLEEKQFRIRFCLPRLPGDTDMHSDLPGDTDMRSSLPGGNKPTPVVSDETVYSDRRGLHFLLGQIISNSIKYCREKPELCFESFVKDDRYILRIKDNGIGVRSCDLPYIFEKGFTGDPGDGRKQATGMGLYLAKEMAKQLNIDLYADSAWGKGFEMQVSFPVVSLSPK